VSSIHLSTLSRRGGDDDAFPFTVPAIRTLAALPLDRSKYAEGLAPEAPLSPQSQLALLAMIGDMVGQDAQFIIATHSPMLLAFPDAQIYSFDTTPVEVVAYEQLDHVRITRDFLNAPQRFLNQILKKDRAS